MPVQRSSLHALMMLIFIAAAGSKASAQVPADQRREELKAAYLFNFVKFVEWPPTVPATVLTICVAGDETFLKVLANNVQNKSAGKRAIAVRSLAQGRIEDDCNVWYLGAAMLAPGKAPKLTDARQPVLTVSDAAGFAQQGGMIELFTENNRLRFNINIENARRAGLSISSSLLQLAASVSGG